MASEYTLTVRLVAKPDGTPGIQAMGGAITQVGGAARGAGQDMQQMGAAFAIGSAAGLLLRDALTALYRGIGQAVDGFEKFQTSMVNVRTLSALTDEQFQHLNASVLDISRRTPKSAADLADGLYQLQSAGVDAQEAVNGVNGGMGALELSARAATAGLATTNEAVDVGTSILNAYQKPVTDLEHIYDTLFQTVNLGKTTFPELAKHIGEVLTPAAQAKVSLEEVETSLVALTNVGVRTPLATTQIKDAILALSTPTPEGALRMRQLGIEWNGLFGTLKQIQDLHLSQQDLYRLIPNSQALQGVQALVGNFDQLQATYQKIQNSGGSTANAFALQAETMANKSQILKNQVQALSDEAFAGLARVLLPILSGLAKLIGFLEPLPEGVKATALAIGVLEGAMIGLGAGLKALGAEISIGLGPASLVLIAVGALAAAFSYMATAEDEAVAARIRDNKALVDQQGRAEDLVGEYQRLNKQLDEGKLKAAEKAKVEARLQELQNQLIALSPAYQTALSREKEGHDAVTKALVEEVAKQKELIEQKRKQAEADLKQAQADLEAARARETVNRSTEKAQLGARFGGRYAQAAVGPLTADDKKRVEEGVQSYIRDVERLKAQLQALQTPSESTALPPESRLGTKTLLDTTVAEQARQAAQGRLELAKAAYDQQKALLDQSLADNIVSYQQYYDQLEKLEREALERQIAAKQSELASASGAGQFGQVSKLQDEIKILQDQEAQLHTDTRNQIDKAEKGLFDQHRQSEIQLLQDTGQTARAAALQMETQYGALLDQLLTNGDTAGAEIVRRLFNIGLAKGRLDQIKSDFDRTTAELAAQQGAIQNQVDAGLITNGQAREKNAAAIEQQIRLLDELVARLQKEAAAAQATANRTGDKGDQNRAQDLNTQALQMSNQVGQLTTQLGQLKDAWFGVKKAGAEALAQNTVQELLKVEQGAEGVGEAFQNMALGVVKAIEEVLLKLALMKAAEALFGASAKGGNTYAQAIVSAFGGSFADGGAITGPGGPTSDNLLIAASPGEYMINADAVSHWGTGFMDSINSKRIPGFANGGAIGGPSAAGAAKALVPNIRIVNVTDPSMVDDYLASSRGEQAVLNVLQRNPGILQSVGG